jgi:hypothetical protein
MLHVIIIPLVTLLATALPSVADTICCDPGSKHCVNPGHIFKYRDALGKLLICNQPPPAGAEFESHREATPADPADGNAQSLSEPSTAPRSGRPAPEPMLSYVDLNPLELQDTGVERSNVYWKRFVTGVVKNRSGRTTAANVMVRTSCTLSGRPADTGQASLGTIGPRGAAGFQIPIILDVQPYWKKGQGWFTPKVGPVHCDTEVTYDTL